MNPPDDLFVIGKIVKSCNVRGRLKAISYLESHDTLQSLEEVYIGRERDKAISFRLRIIQARGKIVFLEVEGVENIEIANTLLECQLFIPESNLKKLPENEYYWRDIIGLKVVTEDGGILGFIESVLPTGSNDVYVCGGGEREILLPGIADVIRKIDIKQGMMVVRLLEGL